MKLSELFRSQPRKSAIATFCNGCQTPLLDKFVFMEVTKNVITDSARPQQVNIAVSVCGPCYGELLYEMTRVHREVMT